MPTWSASTFQDSNSFNMKELIEFNEHCMTFVIAIAMITGMMTFFSSSKSPFSSSTKEHEATEIFWSSIPGSILLMIAMPSMEKLYSLEENNGNILTIKAIGHQWYWSYEYNDLSDIETESFIEDSEHRLIMAEEHLILPTSTNIQILTTSTDVIHSWTVPSLGVKADAVPGRINQMLTSIVRPTVMAGQCSEICGANHSFMPITVSSLTPNEFSKSMEVL